MFAQTLRRASLLKGSSGARFFRPAVAVRSAGLSAHKMDPNNTADTPFDFTPESMKQIEWVLTKYPPNYKRSAVMPLLQIAQEQNDNWLSLAAMNKIAEMLDMPPIRVYEVATFYTMYNREKQGKYHIQLCGTTPCQLCGSESINAAIEGHLGIKCGETTKDGMFTLQEVECLGACVNAPMIQINNHEFYENLTPATTVELLKQLQAGKTPKIGPQTPQVDCEGPLGKTSLFDPDSIEPVCRDLDKIKADYLASLEEK